MKKESSGSPGWSALDYETHAWVPAHASAMSRTQRKKHAGPYSAAVVPAIASVSELRLADETLAVAEEASNAIVRFDATAGATFVPFASVLLRSESAASSQIENLTASAQTIALAQLGAAKRNGQIIVANAKAMTAAVALADQLGTSSILEMHRALLEDTQPDIVGHWRTSQVWIGGSNYGPHGALFVPPHHDRVPAAMTDLVRFLDRDDLPVLTHAALAHAQFETIHPFPDGNGRTGRALVHALLAAKGLTRNLTIPLSAGLLVDTDAYFDALTRYREGEPDDIVRRFAEATFRGIANGTQLLEALQAVKSSWSNSVQARADAAVWRLVDVLFNQPVISSRFVQTKLGVTAATALGAIEKLETAGALVLHKAGKTGKGNRVWAAPAILHELDDFARRAGRRS